MQEEKVWVEFVKPELNECSTANLPTVVNPKKPFELAEKTAKAYINEGFLKLSAKPKADKSEVK